MNIEQARFNMIEQQIRPWDVLDPKVLTLLAKVKREDFVPAAYRDLAFADLEIPLGEGQVMLPPRVEARLLQELGIGWGAALAILMGLAMLPVMVVMLWRRRRRRRRMAS